jgi:hypothetical protein
MRLHIHFEIEDLPNKSLSRPRSRDSTTAQFKRSDRSLWRVQTASGRLPEEVRCDGPQAGISVRNQDPRHRTDQRRGKTTNSIEFS